MIYLNMKGHKQKRFALRFLKESDSCKFHNEEVFYCGGKLPYMAAAGSGKRKLPSSLCTHKKLITNIYYYQMTTNNWPELEPKLV